MSLYSDETGDGQEQNLQSSLTNRVDVNKVYLESEVFNVKHVPVAPRRRIGIFAMVDIEQVNV